MLATINKNCLVLVGVMLSIVACMSPQERWRGQMDYYVAHRHHLDKHMSTYKASSIIENIKEVRPGVLEYYIERGKGILKRGEECKTVFVVEKATDVIIGWRYYGDPRYCFLT